MCKDLSASTIMMAALIVIALVYAIEESALANELTLREACRSHPVSLWPRVALLRVLMMRVEDPYLQDTKLCQHMRKMHDYDDLSVFTRISNHLDWPSDIQTWPDYYTEYEYREDYAMFCFGVFAFHLVLLFFLEKSFAPTPAHIETVAISTLLTLCWVTHGPFTVCLAEGLRSSCRRSYSSISLAVYFVVISL
jgi:hypothetical protein